MSNQKRYSIQEFANLCHTTKDTLFHYHKMKLIKPHINENNHYREYSSSQLLTFHRISLLKKSGCTLNEIEDYLYHQDAGTLPSILEESRHRLNEKLNETQRAIHQLDRIEYAINYSQEAFRYEPYIEEIPEGITIATTKYTGSFMWEGQEIDSLSEHIDYCETESDIDLFPLGYVCSPLSKSPKIQTEAMFSYTRSALHGDRFEEVPAGTYINILHKGDFGTISKSIRKIKEYVSVHNLTTEGNLYISYLIDSFTVFTPNDFIVHIFTKVK